MSAPMQIDIPVSADLQRALNLPECEALRVPMPSKLQIQLPVGPGKLTAFTDMSKGIPNDCSMVFNLMLQLAPLLAAMDCLFKILKLLEPLTKAVTALTKPELPSQEIVKKLADAVIEITPCFTMINLPRFGLDILCLIRAVLRCLIQQLRSVRDLMSGLTLRLEAAAGNDDLTRIVECSQENAQRSMENLTQAIEPITTMLVLVSPILELAGLPPIGDQLQTPGAAPEDVEQLDTLIDTLQGVVDMIDDITGGACGA